MGFDAAVVMPIGHRCLQFTAKFVTGIVLHVEAQITLLRWDISPGTNAGRVEFVPAGVGVEDLGHQLILVPDLDLVHGIAHGQPHDAVKLHAQSVRRPLLYIMLQNPEKQSDSCLLRLANRRGRRADRGKDSLSLL